LWGLFVHFYVRKRTSGAEHEAVAAGAVAVEEIEEIRVVNQAFEGGGIELGGGEVWVRGLEAGRLIVEGLIFHAPDPFAFGGGECESVGMKEL
jgi:hypothetical protein